MNIFIVVLLFSSCGEKKKIELPINIEEDNQSIILDLPKDIYVNEIINDTLYYKSPLDTIKLSQKDERYVFFYMATDTIKHESVKNIKKIKHHAFLEKEKGVIPFKFSFERTGDNYFSGVIKDQVILDNYQDGKARIITHESVVTVRVWVKQHEKQRM